MNLLKFVFILLLLLFPLGQIARFEFQNGVAITLNDAVVGIVGVIWIFTGGLKKQWIKKFLTKPILIFVLIAFLSLIINIRFLNVSEFLISLLYLIRWIFYASLFFVVCGFDIQFKKRIVKFMVFIGGLVMLGGYLQYFLYPSLRNLYYLGWDEHLYRMFSSFLDPNFAGAFFVLYFLLLLGLLFDYTKSEKKYVFVLLLALLGILSLAAVFLTFSRSALIILVVGVFSLLVLKRQKKWIFLLLGIILLIFIITSKNFYIENLNLLRVSSSKARLESASHAITIIRDNSILGVGFNAYRYAQVRYGFIKDEAPFPSHSAAGTDNSFFFVLATTGVVGLVSYLYIWFTILRKAYHVYVILNASEARHQTVLGEGSHGILPHSPQNDRKYVSGIILASCTGLFVNAFFINSLFYPPIMLWMWVLIGLLDNTVRDPSLRFG